MSDLVLKTCSLGAKARKRCVFNEINFELYAGEIVGLFGHNGSGKSTMLRLLANLEKPMEGHVEVAGQKQDSNQHNTAVVLIPDTIKLIMNMTIKENFQIITDGYEVEKELFAKYLKMLRLEETTRISELSKGNQEMVQLMIYFTINTNVYLLDEPFSAVDIYRREFIQKLLLDLNLRNENSVIVITTHLISEVENILERILYLDHGQFVINDTVENLLENHSTLAEYLKEYFKDEVGYDELV